MYELLALKLSDDDELKLRDFLVEQAADTQRNDLPNRYTVVRRRRCVQINLRLRFLGLGGSFEAPRGTANPPWEAVSSLRKQWHGEKHRNGLFERTASSAGMAIGISAAHTALEDETGFSEELSFVESLRRMASRRSSTDVLSCDCEGPFLADLSRSTTTRASALASSL
ncbi:hypothetical protein [Cupriavidus sp. BIS7]|uniref:hypothetical protein n=1 Tax=Cupriavidus sp. BIS7 TaxID=1217718 RepID=UPI0012F6F279|nr:hypothetical protein [Cupriavidus sp. BIS7]